MVTDTSENQDILPPIEINLKQNRIEKFFCKKLDSNINFLLICICIFCLSNCISIFIIPVFPKITWSWLNLFLGLLICFYGSSMMSVDFGRSGSIGNGFVYTSEEIKCGNKIFRIGFACQLIGLILSLFNL